VMAKSQDVKCVWKRKNSRIEQTGVRVKYSVNNRWRKGHVIQAVRRGRGNQACT